MLLHRNTSKTFFFLPTFTGNVQSLIFTVYRKIAAGRRMCCVLDCTSYRKEIRCLKGAKRRFGGVLKFGEYTTRLQNGLNLATYVSVRKNEFRRKSICGGRSQRAQQPSVVSNAKNIDFIQTRSDGEVNRGHSLPEPMVCPPSPHSRKAKSFFASFWIFGRGICNRILCCSS